MTKFWELFKISNSDHPVFALAESGRVELARTAPLLWHGDEGQGRRRTPCLVTSFHSLLGRGVRAGLAAQARSGVKKAYAKLKPNFLGHSYTTRFLHCALPKSVFQDVSVFNAVLEHCVAEAQHMREVGVVHPYTKQRYWCMVLNVVGDWQFLYKAGNMTRSYNNVAKHAQEARDPGGICHLCRAGTRPHPFEHIHTRTPSWLQTYCLDMPFAAPSPLLQIPQCVGKSPELFKFDPWHCWHLGVGKSFSASSLALLSELCEGSSKDARFKVLSAEFMSWCKASKHTPIISKLTKETLGWENSSNFPFGSWYKASITTTFCTFLQQKLARMDSDDEFLVLVKDAVESINICSKGLYENDVFLPSALAADLGQHGLRFLRRYASLARLAADRRRTLFSLLPKHHALQHIFLRDLLLASEKFTTVINPIVYTVQLSEDYIGQMSRLSRRVSPATCAERCIQRHLTLAYRKYVDQGYLVR